MAVMSLLLLLLLLLLYKYKQVSWAAELDQEAKGARYGWPLPMFAHSDRLSCN